MHHHRFRNLLILGSALGAPFAQASVTFIGDAYLPGTGTDASGLGASLLEDGVSPKDGLNGFGSGLAWAGGNLFYALSDRGPNKVAYAGGTSVDNTTNYPCRFQKFEIALDTTGIARVNGTFPRLTVTATHKGTVLFKNAKGNNYTGLSTGFATATNENRRLDPEGLRVASDGSFWVSDEYGPWIIHFDAQGNQIDTLATPVGFRLAKEDSTLVKEMAENTLGRYTNKGAEGLALTPDGKTLLVMLQAATVQDSGAYGGLYNRTLVYDLTNPTAAPKQYIYPVDNNNQTVSEVVAVNNHQFLVDERNGKGGKKGIKLLYLIDIAQDVLPTDLATTAYDGTTETRGLPGTHLPDGIVALKKTLFADIGKLLLAATPWPFTAINGTDSLPDKIEGYAFGPDLPDGRRLLLATNDNDYVIQGGAAGAGYPDYFFAFAVDSADLPGFVLPTFGSSTPTGITASTAKTGTFQASLHASDLVLRSNISGRVQMEIVDAHGRLEKDLGSLDLVADHTHSLTTETLPSGLHILRCRGAVTTSQALLRF